MQNAVEALQEIQKKEGYLPRERLVEVSKELNIPLVKLFGVATFYSQFKLQPEGKHKIAVCRGTACHVKNSLKLLEVLQKKLNIKAGKTTKDKKFTLECVNCIGACAKAPAIMIDEKVYGELKEEDIDKILDQYE